MTDGFITYEQLTDGNQIIADSSMLHWYPKLNIGSPIRIQFYTPDGITERTFRLAAIGMSEKQLVRMMQMEGLFYTAGTLIVSLGLGSIAGYLVFLYAKAERMLNITTFHYPVLPAILLSVAVAVIQLFLTYGISKSFRRSSLIDRIRYSE